ncbi:MAG: hypothetical protein J0H37_00030, partial [Hyphomicrobium denitrificans]|nr:hypothetical protein [Hyphomicrobium denitrificans]
MTEKSSRARKPVESGYSEHHIEVLEGLEPVRRRPGMYIGGTDEKAMHHLFAEVIDNSMDEAVAGHATWIEVELAADGFLTVTDNGRGIPIGPHPKYKNKSALEDVMTAFYEGKYDILLSTAIVESGLDVPNANTLIVHRADMFGLAQLYQLRGRVGRSKTRAYAYITTPPDKKLTEGAEKRLKVLQSLDTLGAGFSLASHDLDIRGAGNLLGEEQSGHIREVGFELYQSMLEEAVAAMKGGEIEADDKWSPEIQLGTSIMIPEAYVTDLQLRLGLYRRLSSLEKRSDIDAFAAELVDRFGSLPDEVTHLLDVMEIKGLCRAAGIAKVDAGPKGGV